ncbi:MAG TPA: SAM-dependent methyltransferase [Fimbriimonas sp.]|nr:SAM-dependent methyltransferase [Fimbriimonas sp.]
MADLQQLLHEIADQRSLIQLNLTDPRAKSTDSPFKIVVRPLLLKGALVYQFESSVGQKTSHRNLEEGLFPKEVQRLLKDSFRQAVIFTPAADYHVSSGTKGHFSVKVKPAARKSAPLEHDRKKQHLIPEGEPCDFLIRLGVMTKNGDVVAGRHDKFRQMNRFVEMVADAVPHFDTTHTIHIVDFGCGKAYLTFALYHYLHVQKGLDVRIVGLDLKADVIAHCQKIADDLGYQGIRFQVGDVKGFTGFDGIDLVVTLHACDTATDDALAKAIEWKAKVILSVPCCQHELFKKLKSEPLRTMLKHGIVKERLSALVTDSLRAQVLQVKGYTVQMLEFIDVEHTPKNLLIRAYLTSPNGTNTAALGEYRRLREFWGLAPYIETVVPGL